MTAAPRPGWYPDPAGATGLYRWWDGSRWAEVTSDSVHAPPPIPVEPELGHVGVALSRRASPLRVATALSLGFALFISASIGLGLVIWRDQPDTSAQRVAGGSAGRPSARRCQQRASWLPGREHQDGNHRTGITHDAQRPVRAFARSHDYSRRARCAVLGERTGSLSLRRPARLVLGSTARSGVRVEQPQ